MSKIPTDKSGRSDALFRAARSDHDPSALDRARVRAALERRLAGEPDAGAVTNADNARQAGSQLAGSGRQLTLGAVIKIAIGVTVAVIGTLAVERFSEPAPPSAAPSERAVPATAPALPPGDRLASVPEPGLQDARTSSGAAKPARTLRPRRARERQTIPTSAPSATAEDPDSPDDLSASNSGPLSSQDAAPSGKAASSRNGSAARPSSPPSRGDAVGSPEVGSRTRAPERDDPTDDSRAEIALVERIQAAIRDGRPSEALELSSEHARRWPKGVFAQEREAVRAVASCELRSTHAATRARKFLELHPDTPMATRVSAACAALLSPAGATRAPPAR